MPGGEVESQLGIVDALLGWVHIRLHLSELPFLTEENTLCLLEGADCGLLGRGSGRQERIHNRAEHRKSLLLPP